MFAFSKNANNALVALLEALRVRRTRTPSVCTSLNAPVPICFHEVMRSRI